MKVEQIKNQEYIIQNVANQVQKAPSPKVEKRDSVSISKEGKQLNEKSRLLKTAVQKFQQLPDVRFEKIEKAVNRIAENFYEHPEVQNKIVENILHEAKELHTLETEREGKTTFTKKVEVIRHRIATGFYNKPEVIQKIAGSLLREVVE